MEKFEHGVKFKITKEIESCLHSKALPKLLELKLSRAVALCCLKILSDETEEDISVLDAVNGFGLPSVQWANILGSNFKITCNVASGLENYVDSCLKENDILNNVEVVQQDPHVLLHSKKLKFVYIEAIGSAVTYLDAAMRSVNHNGLLCVTFTDIAILQNKSPDTSFRMYGANLSKSEYSWELGVRVIAANIVKAGGRWGKGIKIEMCAISEHSITLVCRVLRGPKHSNQSLTFVKSLLHCQRCQVRDFIADTKYKKSGDNEVLCDCGTGQLGSPLLILGPMWSGSLFSKPFVQKLQFVAHGLKIAKDIRNLFELMLVESVCCSANDEEKLLLQPLKALNEQNASNGDKEPPAKKQKNAGEPELHFSCTNTPLETLEPAFYFDFQHHGVKGGNAPRLLATIEHLRKSGHRASKTHFGPRCIRTSACLKQFNDLIKRLCDEKANKSLDLTH